MKILDSFNNVKVVVVGDVMLDRYWWGSVDRISPEAPVPIVKLSKSTNVPGGAANVAANIAGLGASPVLIGIVGDDEEAKIFSECLREQGVSPTDLIFLKGRSTTVKTRIIAHGQQVVRLDQETDIDIGNTEESDIFEKIKSKLNDADVVLISDYAKGFLTEDLLKKIISYSKEIKKSVLIDPKGKDYSKYKGGTLLTPNKREAADAAGLEFNDPNVISKAGDRLFSQLDLQALLITQGEEGMTLFESGQPPFHLQALAREVFDVTGAGDTVIATLAVSMGTGADFRDAAFLANIAARIVVGQIGTSSISISELRTAVEDHSKEE